MGILVWEDIMNRIFTLTLNSAIEEVIFRESGKTISQKKYLTGKAVNSGLVLSNIMIPCNMYIVCGMDTWKQYMSLNQSNRTVVVHSVDGVTRTNQTIVTVGGDEVKRINPGYSLNEQDAGCIRNKLLEVVGKGDYVLVAGSLPRGMDTIWYSDLIYALQKKGAKVLFDAAGETLGEGIKATPFYIKPNEVELRDIVGKFETEQVPNIIRELANKYAIKNVIVTLGEKGACGYQLDTDTLIWAYSKETYKGEVMTTGCGDSFNAGFLYGLYQGSDFIQCMEYGIAFGTANIFAGFPENITWDIVKERLHNISVCRK